MTQISHEDSSRTLPLSIIIVIYNMQREAPRTLFSLTPQYQNVSADQYEVIIVENGSSKPLVREDVLNMSRNFKYFYIEDASPSPAAALNFGVQQSRGQMVGLMIDGARILSPGILAYVLRALQTYKNPVVATLGWHIGPDLQHRSVRNAGYSQEVEDNLLHEISWRENGYQLFTISVFAASSQPGWFAPILESNCVFVRRELYGAIGGYDERFDLPGGGIVNLDFYKRICEYPGAEVIILLGEGTFHQIHGGTATSKTNSYLIPSFFEQYKRIRGQNFAPPRILPIYWGKVPPESFRAIQQSVRAVDEIIVWNKADDEEVLYQMWDKHHVELSLRMKVKRCIIKTKRKMAQYLLGRDAVFPDNN